MRRWLVRAVGVIGMGAALAASGVTGSPAESQGAKPSKPRLSLRASPSVAFTPARISLVAELRGGANDYEEFYCPTIEWDWGDETTSESRYDCEPYQAGKSEIRRRYTAEHTYRIPGVFQIQFRLKQKDKVVAAAQTTVQIRPGIGDIRF